MFDHIPSGCITAFLFLLFLAMVLIFFSGPGKPGDSPTDDPGHDHNHDHA